MSFRKLFLLFLTLFILLQCDEIPRNQFIILGEYQGGRDSELLFRYFDYEGKLVLDTVPIVEGKFKVKGLINGPFLFMVFGNISSGEFNENNAVQFFIEPKTNNIELIEDQFDKILVSGSKTEDESRELDKKTQPFYDQINALIANRDELKRYGQTKKLDSIDLKWGKILSEKKAFELKYAFNHNDSYLSAFLIDRYFPKIPFDSTRIYYNNLNLDVQKSFYGRSIAKKIEQRKEIKVGAIAPNFQGTNHLGNRTSLKEYRGKYVLLDFWASWCAPCRENNPIVRKLYAQYHELGFEIIGISIDDYSEKWKDAIKRDSIGHWNHLITPRRGDITIPYNIQQVPDYILIDKQGTIVGRKSEDKYFTIADITKSLDSIFNKTVSFK